MKEKEENLISCGRLMSCSRHDVRLDAKGQFWSNVSTSTCRCSGIDVSSNSSSSSTLPVVLAGSPSRRGDVAVYVFDINQASLPTPSSSPIHCAVQDGFGQT